MRQAGRCLPEYRAVRKKVDFVTLCHTPELAAEVSLQPLNRLGVDAVILFSDILVPAEPMGFDVEFNPGPVIAAPVRSAADVDRIRTPEPEQTVPFGYETLKILRRELEGRVPLIGFAASPFTLAAYLVEGGGSRNFEHVKGMLLSDPKLAHRLLERVTRMTSMYVEAQVRAGAQVIQLFDTWAGLLGPGEYREFGLRYAQQVLEALAPLGVPRIYFALNGNHLLDSIRGCDAEVLGIDWRTDLTEASRLLGERYALQGNLDPCALMAPPPVIEARAAEIVRRGSGLAGHIFNLGHGVLPTTPVEHVQALVRAVQGHAAS